MPHVAGAGQTWLNHRLANADVSGGQQYEDHFNPADSLPFSYAETTDHLTGRRDSILKRPDTDPLVIHTQTSTEYWSGAGRSPTPIRAATICHSRRACGSTCGQARNILPTLCPKSRSVGFVRISSIRRHLDAISRHDRRNGRLGDDGSSTPESRIPRRADGTLVTVEEWRREFPQIPGVATPRAPSALPLLDFEPQAEIGILKAPDIGPGGGYTIFVPAVDEDGNDRAGVRAPMVAAPLGTYCGWNLRARGFGYGAMHEFSGSYIPLPETPEERRTTDDPRRSILRRYSDAQSYVARSWRWRGSLWNRG